MTTLMIVLGTLALLVAIIAVARRRRAGVGNGGRDGLRGRAAYDHLSHQAMQQRNQNSAGPFGPL